MPCYEAPIDTGKYWQTKYNEIVALLCQECEFIDTYTGAWLPGLEEWYRKHQLWDAERKEMESQGYTLYESYGYGMDYKAEWYHPHKPFIAVKNK